MFDNKILDVNQKEKELQIEKVKSELRVIVDKMDKKLKIAHSYRDQNNIAESLKTLDEVDELRDQYEEKEKDLKESGGVFEGIGASNTNHGLTSGNGFNEALENRVHIVKTKTYKGKFDDRNYYITHEKKKSLDLPIDVVDLTDYITSHEYDLSLKNGALQSIHGVDSDFRDDDPKTFDILSREIEDESYINSVNKMILAELTANKTVIMLEPTTLNNSMHTHLCAKAKKRTIIITNNNGMKKLDVTDEKGVALVKRIDGKVMYKDSFEIVEIDNDFLPDLTEGSPCFIGDIYGACALIKYREKRELQADGVEAFEVYSYRYIDYVKAIQRTNSDKAYIAGYLA